MTIFSRLISRTLALVVIVTSLLCAYGQNAKTINPKSDSAGSANAQLDAVVHRATEYVKEYETEFGNLIGKEEYLQTSIWSNGRTLIRHTSSDFVLIEIGTDWDALRVAHVVDGRRVNSALPLLDSAFDDSAENNAKRFLQMKAENSEYNIGDIVRETNVPTLAIQVLRDDEVSHFVFERAGGDKLDGVAVWRIKYHEISGPTLVVNHQGGESLYSWGTLWIEPDTGKVRKTEFHIDNGLAHPDISSNVVVTYSEDQKLQIMTPRTMTERYETVDNRIDTRAEYSSFHRFQVETHFDFGSPASPRPSPNRHY